MAAHKTPILTVSSMRYISLGEGFKLERAKQRKQRRFRIVASCGERMKESNDGQHIFTLDYETSAFLYGDEGPPSGSSFGTPPPFHSFQHPHSTSMKQEWRRYGAARRKELVAKDEKEGGTRFELHKKCRIDHYFSISDRVRVATRLLLLDVRA
jgi:hypothetical protein